jgi:DNA-binding response OmpR family regulator
VTALARQILVIDADVDFLSFMAALFEDEGHRVALAASVAEARCVLAERRPDLIISDLRVWRLPARELLPLLSADPQIHGIPLLLCSVAAQEVQHLIDVAASSHTDVLAKPFAIEELLERVNRLLEQAPAQSAGD